MLPINEHIEILAYTLETTRQTGCKVYHGVCEECPFCIEGETAGYFCGISEMQTILDTIVDENINPTHEE